MFRLKYPMILASSSPRRREILSQVGFDFMVETADVDEDIKEHNPKELVEKLSALKAQAVFGIRNDSIVVGSDTIVSINGGILGKPNDKMAAFEMLKTLSGEWHEVYTGVTVLHPGGSCTFSDCTKVKMEDLSDDIIEEYIETGEPMDKAGAYGIQAIGAVLVESIEGSYHNVMGFPISRFVKEIRKMGLVL